jgi:hypothetical protein
MRRVATLGHVENTVQFLKARISWIGSIAARTAVLGLLALALVAQSHATTILLTMAPNISDYHNYTYKDIFGNLHSEYSGPYPATLSDGSYGSGAGVFVMCYDINMAAYVGATYAGIMVLPTTPAEIEAAYLQKELADAGGYNADVQTISGPISMAVWQLMDPSSQYPAPFPLDPLAAPFVAEAENAYLTGKWTQADAAYYAFWKPVPITTTQRFGFVYGQAPQPGDITTPEPASVVLLLLGGVLVAAGKIHS